VLKPLHILGNPASTVGQVLVPAGLDRSVGRATAAFTKDPTDPQWENDAAMKARKSWMAPHYPAGNATDYHNVFGNLRPT
jgi:branched-chain amino acid transport system substrate-binding protein